MAQRRLLVMLLLASLIAAAVPGATQAGPEALPVAGQSPNQGPDTAAIPAGTPDNWWATAQEGIRQSEYNITWQEPTCLFDLPAAYQAPNRAQGIRAYFTPQGLRVIPRAEATPSWQIGVRLSGVDAPRQTIVSGNRIEYRYEPTNPLVSEWYVNGERGLEHGMTLVAGAPGTHALKVALSGRLTPRLTPDGTVLEFITGAGTVVLRYGPLIATDATGQAVPMELSLGPSFLQISLFPGLPVSLPVTLHALLASPANLASTSNGLSPTPNWTAEGDQADALFGLPVATAGDVNGDGYADVIVGAYEYDNGQTDEGRAYVFYGSTSGLSMTPDWIFEGNQEQAYFGYAVGTAGDVNGDGFSDIIVAANGYDNGEVDEGRVYAFHGSVSGPSPTSDWMAEGDQAGAYFGHSVGTAGDVNGDGYSDVLIGALMYDHGQIDVGRAFAYYGSAAGLSTAPDWTAAGDQGTAWFGYTAGTAGDVNGDGFSDIIVGAPLYHNDQADEGRVYVYHGSAAGPSMTPDWMMQSDQESAWMGWSAGTAGDIDGDGFSDVIIGAPLYDNGQVDEGRVYVYQGSAAGLNPAADWMVESDQDSAQIGWSVGTAGDVNGDGYADAIVGVYGYDNGQTDEGEAYVYHGSAAGLSSSIDWRAEGNQAYANFGYAVGTAGDVNGDGYADIVIGAPYYDNGEASEGMAFVYHGSPAGLSPTPGWTDEGDQLDAVLGCAAGTAGDVNGDGFIDIVVGAPHYDNGETDEGIAFVYYGAPTGPGLTPDWSAEGNQAGAYMGFSAGTAGDVNGDGYADVIIGELLYDNGQTDEGRTLVYHGSAVGLSPSPSWTAEGNVADGWFGYAVGTAGDVNGDGYSDVIVGASRYQNGQVDEGAAFVYMGSESGLDLAPSWTGEGNQQGAMFGIALGTAGDVDGDGYSDIVVGAYQYDNGEIDEGRAYLYAGSPEGLDPSPSWTAESDQEGARFGISVGTAGDVNGDGDSDVVVGAYYYDNGEIDEGRAYAYYGSAAGLNPTADWVVESDQGSAWFGNSVGTAGDVNGDGYADVIVGAFLYDNGEWDEGRAFVYHGSPAGLGPIYSWAAESNQVDAGFGFAASTAGDVNGDGYADVIIGANGYDNPETNEGRAFLYYGNSGGGLSLAPRQRRADNSAPIGPLGMSDADAFRLALLGRTPFGRGQVKLEWEVKPLGTPFDGTDTQQSASWMDTSTAGAELDELVSSLSFTTPYHWRVRLFYHPATTPFQHYSRWLTMPWNGWNETDLRTPEQAIAGLVAVNDSPTVLGATTALTATVAAGSNVLYSWVLGDGTTGAGPLLAHTYPAAGTYTALVTASNAVSAITATTVVTVEETITGLVTANDSPTALGQPTYLTATVAAGSNVIYAWTLGDGATGAGPALAHTYLDAGIYTALVTASNAVSAITATTVVTVEETIAGLAAANDSPTPLGNLTHLTATVTAGSNVVYAWDLGDGTGGAGSLLAHTYLAAGTYTALVTATNAVGAITATTTVQIVAAGPHTVYLPVVYRAYFLNPYEPNDSPTQAWGPLEPAQAYASLPDDADDWFYVELGTAGDLRAVVTGYSAQGNLLLYAEGNYTEPIAQWGQGGSTMVVGPVAVAAGRYYVRVYTAGGSNTDQLYNLVVTLP